MTKEQRKVYEAAMRWWISRPVGYFFGADRDEIDMSKACAAARKKEKK